MSRFIVLSEMDGTATATVEDTATAAVEDTTAAAEDTATADDTSTIVAARNHHLKELAAYPYPGAAYVNRMIRRDDTDICSDQCCSTTCVHQHSSSSKRSFPTSMPDAFGEITFEDVLRAISITACMDIFQLHRVYGIPLDLMFHVSGQERKKNELDIIKYIPRIFWTITEEDVIFTDFSAEEWDQLTPVKVAEMHTGTCRRCCDGTWDNPLNRCPNFRAHGMDCVGKNSRLGYCMECLHDYGQREATPVQNCPTFKALGHCCVPRSMVDSRNGI
mgnify:CR=1 FL=1